MITSAVMRKPCLDDQQVHAFLQSLFAEDLRAKRVLALSYAVLGVIHSASLGVHLIGKARSWSGWYRHMTLCLVAHSFLTTARLELTAMQRHQAITKKCHYRKRTAQFRL